MIKLFCGTDDFDSYIAAKKQAKFFAKENNTEVRIVNADSFVDVAEFVQLLEGQGFFEETNILLLKRVEQNKILAEYLINNFDQLDHNNLTLWSDSSLDKKIRFYKTFKTKKRVQEFVLPKQGFLNSWVNTQSKNLGIALTQKQVNYIIERMENKWQMFSVLRKIQSFLISENRKTITDQELEEVDGTSLRGDIWKLVDCYTQGSFEAFIKEFQKLMTFEDQSQLVIAMLSRQIDMIYKIKIAEESNINLNELGIHPYVSGKIRPYSSLISFDDIEKMNYELYLADRSIKQGILSPTTAIITFAQNLKGRFSLINAFDENQYLV
jgi:DNA polymerase III delta subunit